MVYRLPPLSHVQGITTAIVYNCIDKQQDLSTGKYPVLTCS